MATHKGNGTTKKQQQKPAARKTASEPPRRQQKVIIGEIKRVGDFERVGQSIEVLVNGHPTRLQLPDLDAVPDAALTPLIGGIEQWGQAFADRVGQFDHVESALLNSVTNASARTVNLMLS